MKRLTQEQWKEYNNAIKCSICTKPFKSADKKVCDHDHLTGECRGPAHNACNLNYRIDPKKMKVPCIVHNLKGILFLCCSYFHDCYFFETHFDSYFYDSPFDSYFLFTSFVAILQIKIVSAFF